MVKKIKVYDINWVVVFGKINNSKNTRTSKLLKFVSYVKLELISSEI